MSDQNWQNRTLFHGDNLKFLRAMNSESVHLIATDPPFKKGKDFHATPDSLAAGAKFQDRWRWETDVHPDWLDQIRDDYPEIWLVIDTANAIHMRKTKKNRQKPREKVGSDMGAYLCFMAVRLLEMHRVLHHDGAIYLHCDPTASHYLKLILDAIFGKKNFRNEMAWCYPPGGKAPKYGLHRKHDVLLYFSKGTTPKFNHLYRPLTDYQKSKFTTVDEDGRKYKEYRGKTRTYLDDIPGSPIPDWWDDIPSLGQTISKERTGYPTQKPLSLYERILLASSSENDVVLDPFAGCATTLVIAERMKRRWVGIDLWEKVKEVVVERLEQEGLIGEDTEGLHGRLFAEQIHFTDQVPVRADDKQTAAPTLRVRESILEPPGQKMTRSEMYEYLLSQYGSKCQGCYREFDDSRYLELDHNTPRADGGLNHITNRVLLCSPCNRLKSNTLTLSGLRRENKKLGYMKAKL